MEARHFTCINCPMGCSLEVREENGELKVSGNTCKRGVDYAKSEVTDPKRTVTSSVFVKGGAHPTVSVKTSSDIPKRLIRDCIRELSGLKVEAPINIGDVIVKNILGTGVDIVATRNVLRN
jgi:Uncharacterized protein with conserved CXXC pairs